MPTWWELSYCLTCSLAYSVGRTTDLSKCDVGTVPTPTAIKLASDAASAECKQTIEKEKAKATEVRVPDFEAAVAAAEAAAAEVATNVCLCQRMSDDRCAMKDVDCQKFPPTYQKIHGVTCYQKQCPCQVMENSFECLENDRC